MAFIKFMSICALYSVLTVCVISKAPVENSKDVRNLDTAVNVTSACGGVITDPRGRISYKIFEPLLPNERCVWVIQAPDAGEYDVYLDSLGIPESVIISALGFGFYGNITSVVPTSPDDIYIPNQNLLVITLYTGPENITDGGTGFSLLFVGTPTADGQLVSKNSTHQFISANSGHHKFPLGRHLYDNSELSTFIVTPTSDTSGNFRKTKVVYTLKGLGEECCDIFWYYFLNLSYTGADKWEVIGAVCTGTQSYVYRHHDLILLIFNSDESEVDTGFHLYVQDDHC